MPSTSITIVVVVVIIAALIWLPVAFILLLRKMLRQSANELRQRARDAGEELIIEPQSCLYRGADREFGNVKGNGVITLTNKRIIFKKLTGQQIEIDRSRISKASVENTFKGKTAFATGGRHLIIETNDGNKIGFLVKNAESWIEKINA